jgi:hypothetical protein
MIFHWERREKRDIKFIDPFVFLEITRFRC